RPRSRWTPRAAAACCSPASCAATTSSPTPSPSASASRPPPTDMDIDNLVQMANRIGEFFQAMPDRAEAVDGVAQHVKKFWGRRMRPPLPDPGQAHGSGGLHPLVAEAVAALAPAARA